MGRHSLQIAAILSFILPSAPFSTSAIADFNAQLNYSDTQAFWPTVRDIRNSATRFDRLTDLLNNHFGEPEEGFGRLNVEFESETQDWMQSVFSRGYIGLRGEVLVGGLARNRMMPEVHGYAVYSGQASFGLREAPSEKKAGFGYEVGTLVGAGKERSVHALAVDLYPEVPYEDAFIFFWGADVGASNSQVLSPLIKIDYRAELPPTYFYVEKAENHIRWRWKTLSEATIRPFTDGTPVFEIAAHAILGQQPTPMHLLPRTWDTIHELEFAPSLGQLFGLGSALILRSDDRNYSARIDGGLYGGYLGTSLRGRISNFTLQVSTFGYEQSAGFRLDASRIRTLEVGYSETF